MKTQAKTNSQGGHEDRVREEPGPYGREDPSALVRTQVYLAERHRRFLAREAKQRGVSMAELLREWVDEKMTPETDSWEDNPLLQAPAEDPAFTGHEDGSVDADTYIYGSAEA